MSQWCLFIFRKLLLQIVPFLPPHWSVCGKREVDVVYFALPPCFKDSTGLNAHFGISELCSYYFADQLKMFNCWFFPFFVYNRIIWWITRLGYSVCTFSDDVMRRFIVQYFKHFRPHPTLTSMLTLPRFYRGSHAACTWWHCVHDG